MCRAMLERECFCSLLLRAGLHWRVILESYPRATLPLSQWEHLTKPAGLVQGIGLKCGQCFQHDWWLVALHWGHGWNHSIRYTQKVAYIPCTVLGKLDHDLDGPLTDSHNMVPILHRNYGYIPRKARYAQRNAAPLKTQLLRSQFSTLYWFMPERGECQCQIHGSNLSWWHSLWTQPSEQGSVGTVLFFFFGVSTKAITFPHQSKASPCTRGAQTPTISFHWVQRASIPNSWPTLPWHRWCLVIFFCIPSFPLHLPQFGDCKYWIEVDHHMFCYYNHKGLIDNVEP